MSHKQEQQGQFRANLIQQAGRRGPRGPSGVDEVKSLKGRIGNKMGDKVEYTRPTDLLARMNKKRERDLKEDRTVSLVEDYKHKKKADILEAIDEFAEGIYRPRTRETTLIYEKLLVFVQQEMGSQPHEILASGVDGMLDILKDESKTNNEKQKDMEELFDHAIKDTRFHTLVQLGEKVSDYHDTVGDEMDLDENINVVFGEEEEENNTFYAYNEGDDNSDDESDVEVAESGTILKSAGGQLEVAGEGEAEGLSVHDIDAYWIQRKVGEFIDDANKSKDLAHKVLEIMEETESDEADVENRIVELLGFEQLDFVLVLMTHRPKIVWATKYKRANEDEKKDIEKQLSKDENLSLILRQLKGVGISKKSKKEESEEAEDEGGEKAMDLDDDETVPSHWKTARKVLDLEALTFGDTTRHLGAKKFELPEGSRTIPHKEYEEILVPAPKKPEGWGAEDKLIPITELPEWAHVVFKGKDGKGIKKFNPLQSAVFKAAFYSPNNMLIAAPTGSGKTNSAMLTILHEIGCNRNKDGSFNLDAFKIVYIAPMKSLVSEMVLNFGRRLAPLGITVRELSGDQNLNKQQISETQIIVTTPEKWDVVTRKSGDRTYTKLVRLVIIDEVHLLHNERGPVLEAVVSRTLRQVEEIGQMTRIVALSATLPNYEDVAMFLRVEDDYIFHFANAHRPVPLELTFIGINGKKAVQRFKTMNEVCYKQVMLRAGKHQMIVFCHSRKETAKTARFIRDTALLDGKISNFVGDFDGLSELLKEQSEIAKNKDLKDLLPFSFGIHHAGMTREDRNLVEALFDAGHIQVLVSTATLAWGVNLPAHAVIIKGTQIYNPEKGRWVELSGLDVMQMLGRAGRPQYDEKGEGILITSQREVQYYLSLTNTQLPVLSQLIGDLPDLVLAEAVLGTICNIDEAVNWLCYTYLYVCMLRSPSLYGISNEEIENDPYLEQRRADLIHSALTVLHKEGLVQYERVSGSFRVTDIGRVASYYYLEHTSMATYNEYLKPIMSDIELFRLFSLSGEFKNMSVRSEEKGELATLIERVPIPVKESVDDPSAKANVLLQAYISRLKLEGFALMSDMVYVTQSAGRLIRALFEVALKRGWAQLARGTLEMALMVDRRMWRSQSPLKQFGKAIPGSVLKNLARRSFPWERMWDLNPQEIGDLIRDPSKGKEVYRHIHMFPTLRLSAHVQPVTPGTLQVELTITPDFNWSEKHHQNALGFWIIVEDCDGDHILYNEYFLLKKKFSNVEDNDHLVEFTVPMMTPVPPQYFVRVVSDRWLSSEVTMPVSFRQLIMPRKTPPYTDVLDLRPISSDALENEEYKQLFGDGENKFWFNPLQTQTFQALYRGDGNVLVAASAGNSRIVCAELAILRTLSNNADAKIVYISPHEDLCAATKRRWDDKFGVKLGKLVLKLTGETATDLKLLKSASILICTAAQWDRLSRRWKKRKAVQEVDLVVVDQLNFIGSGSGHVLEVAVSRMRYISSAISRPIRIVALAAPTANARDLSEWLGCSSSHSFNFDPTVRQVPLQIHMQSFDQVHFAARLTSMERPMTHAIKKCPADKPMIIFVHSRAQAVVVATQLSETICVQIPDRFLRVTKEQINKLVEKSNFSARVKYLLVDHGIGLYHENMSEKNRREIESLFARGFISALIVTRPLCWALQARSYLVFVAGTQYYDAKEHRYIEYPLADVLEMVGKAGRIGQDAHGESVLYCATARKQYYKRYLFEALPVESQLDHHLQDHLNSEIVTRTIGTKQDSVDYLTWSFLYRRLVQNPNYYNLKGRGHQHLSDYLSQLIEDTIEDLAETGMISEEDDRLVALNPGIIAAYYYVNYITIDLFVSSLSAKTRMKGLIEVISASSEFDIIPVRRHEASILRTLANHLPMKINTTNFTDGRTKVNILMQAHFSRVQLPKDLQRDQKIVIETALSLVQAVVDVVSSEGWLAPALAAQELSQMLVQGIWDNDSPLKQLPCLSKARIETAKKNSVESIYDLQEAEDNIREKITNGLSSKQLTQLAKSTNRYPDIEMAYAVEDEKELTTSDSVVLMVQLERDIEEEEEEEEEFSVGPVSAPLFPKSQAEGWWLVVADTANNKLYGIKRITIQKQITEKLEFMPPTKAGSHKLTLYLICDSYAGCDQELEFQINLLQGEEESESESDSSDE